MSVTSVFFFISIQIVQNIMVGLGTVNLNAGEKNVILVYLTNFCCVEKLC